jgi:hypothetical protein
VFQPFGNIKKQSEEITAEELNKQQYKIPYVEQATFIWCGYDWREINSHQPLTYLDAPTFKIIDTSEEKRPPKKLYYNTTTTQEKVYTNSRLNHYGNAMH